MASLAKAGTLSIIGVYPPTLMSIPIGLATNKELSIKMGNRNHRKSVSHLVDLVRNATADPFKILTKREPMTDVIAFDKSFTSHQPGWIKVESS